MRAIETYYNGYKFRSRLEARWAVFFDQLGVEYDFELEGFTSEFIYYLPDFWLEKQRLWIEVKPSIGPDDEALEKAAMLASQRYDWSVVIVSGEPYKVIFGGGSMTTFERGKSILGAKQRDGNYLGDLIFADKFSDHDFMRKIMNATIAAREEQFERRAGYSATPDSRYAPAPEWPKKVEPPKVVPPSSAPLEPEEFNVGAAAYDPQSNDLLPLPTQVIGNIHLLTVCMRSTGNRTRDVLRLRRIYGIVASYPGKDRFNVDHFAEESGYRLQFPNDTTGVCPELLNRLASIVRKENVAVEEISPDDYIIEDVETSESTNEKLRKSFNILPQE